MTRRDILVRVPALDWVRGLCPPASPPTSPEY